MTIDTSPTKRNLEIDRLRAMALIIILYGHFCFIFFIQGIIPTITFGTTLLDLSFIISGFVISNSLVSKIDHAKSNTLATCVKAFYLRRFFRIYPPAFAVLLIVSVCSLLPSVSGFSTFRNTMEASLYILTYSFNYYFVKNYHSMALAPFWTLILEEQFYLIFPLFLIFTKNTRQRLQILIPVLILITFIIRPITLHFYGKTSIFFSHVRIEGFIYGYFIYCLMQQPWINILKSKTNQSSWLKTSAILILFVFIFSITCVAVSPGTMISIGAFLGAILVSLAALHLGFVNFPWPLQNIFDFIGSRFYSLYLIHVPAMLMAKSFLMNIDPENSSNLIYAIPAAIIFVFFGMELLYRFIETPSNLKGRIISKNMLDKQTKESDDLAVITS